MKGKNLVIVLLLVALVAVVFWRRPNAPAGQTPTTTNTNVSVLPSLPRGVSLSPQSFNGPKFTDFFTQAEKAGTYLSWAGAVTELGKLNGAPAVVVAQAKQHSLTPLIIVSPTTADLATAGAWKTWHDRVVSFAKSSHVAYFGIGNEINKNLSVTSLATFAQKFPGVMADIKKVSPQTKVFPIFQLEWMKGLRGGLFGGKNNAAETQWNMLAQFATADLIGFTSYPGLIYGSPSDIPDTYYNDIISHTDQLVAITETGWFRTGPDGWTSNADTQAAYIRRFFALLDGVKPRFTLWSFLYDQAVPAPFTTMGLLKPGDASSPAWEAWKVR